MKKIIFLTLLTIVGIFRASQMVYADSSILSVLPASLDSTVGRVFSVSVQIDPASNNVCVIKGTLNFDNLSCQDIAVANNSVIAMITPTCASPSFVLGIPKCATTIQSILSVSVKGVQAGQGNLSLTEVNVIGAGVDVPFSAEGGVYNITAVSITAPKTTQQDAGHAGQQKQATTPQQGEFTPLSTIPIIVSPASLLTVMVNILSFGTGKDWLAVIVTILIILVLAIFYFIGKKKNICNHGSMSRSPNGTRVPVGERGYEPPGASPTLGWTKWRDRIRFNKIKIKILPFRAGRIHIIVGVGIVAIIGSWLTLPNIFWQANVEENNILQEARGKEVVLVIDDGGGNPNTLVTEFKEGMTAFDLLKEESEKLVLALKTKNYDIGIFIEAIGDRENGQDGKYWLYYINGQLPMVSADKMEIKAGDKVEFKFEKSSF